MTKKAFCVGINDYPYDGNDLNGCVNDANAWADLLVNHFDFPKPDVTLMTNAQATKANMVGGSGHCPLPLPGLIHPPWNKIWEHTTTPSPIPSSHWSRG